MRSWPVWFVVAACGAPSSTRSVAITPRPTITTPAGTPIPTSCTLGARRLATDTASGWGSTSPSVWLTPHGTGLEVWYPGHHAHETSRLGDAGTLDGATDIEPFASMGEADNPVVAEGAGVVAYAETVYRTQQDADVVLTLRSGGTWSKPVEIMPNPELDEEPAMAFSGGALLVVWKHGGYPMAPDLAVAIVSRDGRVLRSSVVEPGAQAEGIAVVGVPNGWLVLYTPSSVLSQAARGLVALAIDSRGNVTARMIVSKSAALWPVAAWNGHDVGVAYRDETDGRRGVSFVRVAVNDGHALGPVVTADQHPDPIASFRPMSLLADGAGWWLADVAGFSASVVIARESEGRVVQLDSDGKPQRSIVVSDPKIGASIVRIARYQAGVRGVFVEDRGDQHLRAFDVGCVATTPPPAADACAARTASFPTGRFEPMRGLVESSVELAGDLVVGYRPTQQAGNVMVSRMSADGVVAWKADLGPTYHPQVASARGRVAVVVQTGSGSGQSLITIDAVRGTIASTRAIAVDARTGCIAATPAGWMVASGAPFNGPGKPAMLLLADDGTQRERHELDEPMEACALAPAGHGFVLAYTHPGPMSETAWLFTRVLDERGRAQGSGTRIAGVHFATSPTLVTHAGAPVLLFGDALERNLSAVLLDAHGGTPSRVVDVAETYGLSGFTLWSNDIIWATNTGIGRRGCLDKLLTP